MADPKIIAFVATQKQLTARGIDFGRFPGLSQDEHGVWAAPVAAKVTWFKDPDGNILSLTEFPR